MNGMDLCCQEQKTECVYHMYSCFYVSLQFRNLNFFKISHYLQVHTVKNMKLKTLLTQKPLQIDQKFQQIQIPQIFFCTPLKFVQSWCQNKRTLLKNSKNSIASIFIIFHFKEKQIKQNSVFTILHISCKFPQNRPKKVAVGLNGLTDIFIK